VRDDDRRIIYTGAGGIKKGEVLAWCCQSSEEKHASMGWTEMKIDKEKGKMTDFRAMQITSRSEEKEKFVNTGKESAAKSLGCENGKQAEDEEPEHDEDSGGVSIGDVKALYKELEERKLKGRL
jgi:hypothetical protein